eukprot:TRINITY_DN20963_c0_g3_i1.p1 TRINITY_DN20963_c0_g3~~TRINITY_DN20963_c0_g3_i1.p1  ORF type:complete len:881 (-),score=82.41 TRINITY_DN20963_c0_g3_i1:148-2790(-)
MEDDPTGSAEKENEQVVAFKTIRRELLELIDRLTCAHELEIAQLQNKLNDLNGDLVVAKSFRKSDIVHTRTGATTPGGYNQKRAILGASHCSELNDAGEFDIPEPPHESEDNVAQRPSQRLADIVAESLVEPAESKPNYWSSSPKTSNSSMTGASQAPSTCCSRICCRRSRRRRNNETLRRFNIKDAFLYHFETLMVAHGFLTQLICLSILGALQVGLYGYAYAQVWTYDASVDPRDEATVSPIWEGFWEAWTFMADPGTHAKTFLPKQRIGSAIIAVLGIIYFAVILGVIVEAVQDKMQGVKKGRSSVVEWNHIVVLGWTDKVIPLISELCCAEQNSRNVVVILADEALHTMRVELSLQLPMHKRYGTKIVCRSGSPLLISELLKVSAEKAKAILVLSPASDADLADSQTLRSVLSLNSLGCPLRGHVVAEVRDIDNEPLLQLVGGGKLDTLVSHDMLGRLMVMAARHPGLAKVYESLLGYAGMEFYIRAWPELVGVKFGRVFEYFPKAVPIGVRTGEQDIMLNPSRGYVVTEDDELIFLAEDADSYKPEKPAMVKVGEKPQTKMNPPAIEKIFICGWRRDIRDVLIHLDNVVARGSQVHLMSHFVPVEERISQLAFEGLDVTTLKNIELVHHYGNTSVRRRLELLPIELFTSVMIFAEQAFELDAMHSDSHALATLLLIRDIQHSRTASYCSQITCELLDSRTRMVIGRHSFVRRSSDFIQSNRLIAQIMAMVGEQRGVKCIFDELLGVDGCNITIEPPFNYMHPDEKLSFWQLSKRVSNAGNILIGFNVISEENKLVLNPDGKDVEQLWEDLHLVMLSGGDLNEPSRGASSSKQLSSLERSTTFDVSAQSRFVSRFTGGNGVVFQPKASYLNLGLIR